MVKVLKCFNFKSSSLLKYAVNEPACLASGQNFLFLGSHGTEIEVFKNQKGVEWMKYCSFQTGAHVSQIEYNETGDYIATVEKKENRQSKVVSVKVYLNWHIASTDKHFRTRVRVAGLGYKSTNVQTGKRLEVVDVPCESNAEYLTSCQETGNLGIVFSTQVRLYHLVEKTIPNSQTTFLDVILFLELQFNHTISLISLCEDFVACSAAHFVQVFQVNISNEDNDGKTFESIQDSTKHVVSPSRGSRKMSSALSSLNVHDKISSPHTSVSHVRSKIASRELPHFSTVGDRSSSTPSPALNINPKVTSCRIEDDPDFIHWTFSTDETLISKTSQSQNETTQITTIELKGLKNFGKEIRPEPSLPDIKDLRGGNHLTTGKTTLSQIVYQYLDESDSSWIHLQLVPTYLIGKDNTLMPSGNGVLLRSPRRSSLAGMSCLLSGSRAGFMYSLIPQPALLSTYKYSSDAIQIKTNGRMMYVLVQNGLEIYTARCLVAAVHNTEHFDDVRNVCPKPDEEICLCGIQQFLGPREFTLTNKHVILFNKMDNAWNINILEEPSVPELYQDIFRFGERYQENAPHTYHHLLLECHMTLKSSLIGQTLSQSKVSTINDLLHELSALLGEYYALPDCTLWHLCLPYYNMSGLSVVDVVRQAVQHRQHSKRVTRYGKGLIQYLRYTLFLNEDHLQLKQGDGDLVLEVCHDCMPERLADIILFSRLKTFTPQNVLKLLKTSSKIRSTSDSKTRTKERLAYVALNLQMCEPDIAVSSLNSIDVNDLIETCLDNPQILHTSMTEFSPLSQLLRCNSPQTLIGILVMLHDKGTMSMDLAIKLLQGKSGIVEIHKNTHVIDYLEALVNDDCRKFSFDEAVPILCEIYIQRLKEWEPPSIRQLTPSMKFKLPNGSGHFGRRHSWLDNLPPFVGAKSITSTCKYVVPASHRRAGVQPKLLQCQKIKETCSCFLCNEDLLKLQALLCYKDVSCSICDKVMKCIQYEEKAFFYDSLAILCQLRTNFEQSVALVVNRHSNISASFGTSVIKNNAKQWELLLNSLICQIGQTDDKKEGTDKSVSMEIVKDVLQEMSQQLKPEVFISVLPGNGNFFFFLPYIQHCLDTQKLNVLKDTILSLGENMTQNEVSP